MPPKYRVAMKETMGSLNKTSPCVVCCGRNKYLNIRHEHLSTAWYNKQMTIQGNMDPHCYFCDQPHPLDHMTRQRVILSTSTLSGVPFLEGWGWEEQKPLHCDMETIPGSTLQTLKKAWERAYAGNPLPIDTVLGGGLNDIKKLVRTHMKNKVEDMELIADLVSREFIDDIKSLYATIKEHSKKYDTDDSLAVLTVLHVPAIYWHDHDGPYPTADYINMKPVVDKINLAIEAFNLEFGASSAPKLHQMGERGRQKGKVRVFMWEAFRETNPKDMMHLKDIVRFRMVKHIVKYFEKATPRAYKI